MKGVSEWWTEVKVVTEEKRFGMKGDLLQPLLLTLNTEEDN